MRLTLCGHDYRYAAEQMMLSLFPDERPGAGDNELTLTLSRGKDRFTADARLTYQGEEYSARRWANIPAPDAGPLQTDRVCQQILKLAFYDAGVKALGHEPPWGALTGVRPVKLPQRALLEGQSPKKARQMMEETYRVAPLRARLAVDCAEETLRALSALEENDVSLYIGIPFCPSRCVYCSFISAAVDKCLPLVEPFTQALIREIAALGRELKRSGKTVRSAYMGGGTPTTLSAGQLDSVLTALEEHIDLGRCAEFTVEAGRPDTITPEKLSVLRKHRVDRVSVNPQSMHDEVLRRMGRPHSGEDILRSYDQVRTAGDFAVNMDLIAGLPGDSPAGFADSLRRVLDLRPENITVHTLALKKGAKLMEDPRELPTPEQVEAMLDDAWAALRERGYVPYYLYRQKYMSGAFENVGWALPGYESLYNIVMMEELHSVLALGGGGVTKLVWPATGKIQRLANPKYPQEYLREIHRLCAEKEEIPWPTS